MTHICIVSVTQPIHISQKNSNIIFKKKKRKKEKRKEKRNKNTNHEEVQEMIVTLQFRMLCLPVC
jgi:hypothetical protein